MIYSLIKNWYGGKVEHLIQFGCFLLGRASMFLLAYTTATRVAFCQSVETRFEKGLRNPGAVVQLQDQLDDILSDSSFSNAQWGVVVQSLETGEYLYRRNENKSFMPASNMKLFTTAAALVKLDSHYKYVTSLLTGGRIEKGVLVGDLIIRGSGDPTISGRFNGGNVLKTFEDWADSLTARGVNEVDGNVIGDDNYFDDADVASGWCLDWNEDVYWYSAYISGLSFNDNCVDATIEPGDSVDQLAKITLQPRTDYITLYDEITTAPPESTTTIDYYRDRGTNIIYARGRIPIGKPRVSESLTVSNPTLYAATVLKETLQRKGIRVRGQAKDVDDIPGFETGCQGRLTFATYTSPPLAEIVKVINKRSQNLYAEQVFKTIGKEVKGQGSIAAATEVAKELFSKIGIDPNTLMISDGSGLSRLNMVTPAQIVTLVRYMSKQSCWKEFYESLPIAGIDGGLQDRMKGTKAENNLRAKTGFIQYVRTLSGYVLTRDGERLVFSLLANNYTVPTRKANHLQDMICVRLADFSRK
jgi:D-alanyl-D-alanine carboxypeptidase/D-alanyl-D-alanine-endopeptidase (penicillin-binding protein 4)